jgi:heat-inducible transcriptional repressor
MASQELSDRSGRVLATLVREYIETGEAVSSQILAKRTGLRVSSATVRGVLVQLEEAGYVHQPHTSAGRVPTDRGYRFFVDLLLEKRSICRPPAAVENELRQRAGQTPLMHELLASVAHLVSRASGHVGFALADSPHAVLKRIDFVSLGGSRVLVVVISRGDDVTQKVVDADEALEPEDLVHAANYLNTEFAGLRLADVRAAVIDRLRQERTLYDQLLARALRLANCTLAQMPQQHTFLVDGASSLVEASTAHAGGITLDTLRALLEMMEEKERLVRLLNQYIDGPGLTVVIGAEHMSPDLRSLSLVASTSTDGTTVRTFGVIGPTRMRYSRAIGVVDGTARAVARVLRAGN